MSADSELVRTTRDKLVVAAQGLGAALAAVHAAYWASGVGPASSKPVEAADALQRALRDLEVARAGLELVRDELRDHARARAAAANAGRPASGSLRGPQR